MKTVVQIIDGSVYVYRNSEKHFKRIRNQITGDRLKKLDLDTECNISSYTDNGYIIINGDVVDK